MESDFIEISGEDDSLLPLPKFPNNDVSSLNKTFFSCSPLHLPRSDRPPLPSRTPAGDKNREKLDSLLGRDGVDKENVSISKPELPKLNMEPQQMKRKKKGGGYNLRKSLAWDRAFFTEEGVLDPLELSMISGSSIGKSRGGMLSVIDEDRGESLTGASGNLVALEENLLKEFPASTANEDRKSSGVVLPKNGPSAGVNVASASKVKRKVLSASDTNRSGSKRSGGPRLVASSSLKRPANLNTSKAATKELKSSKVLVPKSDASMISSSSKNTILSASSSKQNQISQRAVNGQRNIGLKDSLNNSRSAQKNVMSGLASKSIAAKSSVRPTKRNVVTSVSKIHSSTDSRHPLDTKANNGLKTNPAPEPPASGLASNNDGNSSKFQNSVPQNIPRSAGSLQYAQPQKAKPSGLRMPSPSLSFFNQSKASASTSLLRTSNQACHVQSNIPKPRKVGALNTDNDRPIAAPGKTADLVNNVALRPPRSITGSSFPSNVKLDSHEKMSSNLHNDAMQKACMNLTSNCNSSDVLNEQKLHNPFNDFEQHPEPSKNEMISHVGDNELKSNNNKLLLQTALSDQVMEDPDNERVANVYPTSTDLSGAELENPDCTSQLCPTTQDDAVAETRDLINTKCMNHGVFSESLNVESCVPDVNEQSKEKADNKKLYAFQDGQSLGINNDTLSKESGSLSEFQKGNNMLTADAMIEVKCRSVNELESSDALFQSKNLEEAKDSEAGVDIFSTTSQVGDEEVQFVSGILSVGRVNNILSSPAVDNQHIMVVDDASQVIIDAGGSKSKGYRVPSSISPAAEDCSFDVAKRAECLDGDDALPGPIDAEFSYDIKLHGQITSGESEMKEDQITATVTTGDVKLLNVPDIGDFQGCELENLQNSTSQQSAMVQPQVNDAAKTVECLHGDDALPGPIDAEFSYDIKLHSQTTSGESEMMNEDQMTATVTNGQLLNVPDSGDFRGCESETLQHLTSQHSAMVLPEVNDAAKTAECLCGDDALSVPVDAEFSYDIKLHGQSTSGESEMMNEDQITATVITGDIQLLNVPDTGDFRVCELENLQYLTSQHTTMEHLEENDAIPAVQVNGGFDMTEHTDMEDKHISQNNQCSNSDLQPDTAYVLQSTSIVHNDDLTSMQMVNSLSEDGNEILFNKGINFENSRKLDIGNLAESPDFKILSGRGSENGHVLCHHEHTEQTNEEIARVDDSIEQSHTEDAQMQAVDEDLLVDSCNPNLSAVKNMSSECVDGVQEQSGVHTDPDPISVQGPTDSHGYSLNENLTINNFTSEELHESNVCESAMDDESSSNVLTDVTPALKNGGILEEQELESPFDEVSDSFDMQTSIENPNYDTDTMFKHVSLEMSNDQKLVAKSCNSKENQILSSVQIIDVNMLKSNVLSEELERSNDSLNSKIQWELEGGLCATEDKVESVIQDMKFNKCKSDVEPEEGKTTTFQKIGGPNSDTKHELEDIICTRNDNDETELTKKLWNDTEKNDLVIKPPSHAVPFSDEWLAALEAAGEEILTKKSGAVQNSPPEKSLPEPGPWSPVKRKNNQGIGPFDCTKYTNANVNTPPSDSN